MPNFIEIGQTSLEIGGGGLVVIGPRTKKIIVTDGQKRDYLSRDSQYARGATKNEEHRCIAKVQDFLVKHKKESTDIESNAKR